jgi:hypothetical protein
MFIFDICEGNILNHIYIIEKNMAIVKIHLEKYISVLFNILKGLTPNIMIKIKLDLNFGINNQTT